MKVKYGEKKVVSGFCFGRTINGETRWGMQKWIVKYYEQIDGFGNRLLDWWDWEWVD